MSDAEIIKALECCANLEACEKCPMCSFEKYDTDTCEHQIMLYSLDLIDRQKAEIERLNEEIKAHIKKGVSKRKYDIKLIKAEAYKEVVERLCEDRVSNDPVVIAAKCLLKEMVGENDE